MRSHILICVAAMVVVVVAAVWQARRSSLTPAPHPSGLVQGLKSADLVHDLWPALVESVPTPDTVRRVLGRLETFPAAQRALLLGRFLGAKHDAPLNAKYAIGLDGRLLSAPTLRVAVLDATESLVPDACIGFAETVLNESTSADEWSVALRILGRLGTTDAQKALFAEKTRALLRTTTWLAAPTEGFLQAFDAAVFSRDARFLGEMSRLAQAGQRREVRWAAFVAADRLAQADARSAAVFLNSHPAIFAAQTELRAGLYARLDVRSPEHRAALEVYLARTDLGDNERRAFGELFPNHNATWSNNLLTPNSSRPLTEMVAVDRASVQAIAAWRLEARFQTWTDALRQSESRLIEQLAAFSR